MNSERAGPMSVGELTFTGDSARLAVRDALAGYFTTVERQSQRTERVYYDTFDGLLFRAGLTAWLERGQLLLARRDGEGEPLAEPFAEPFAEPLTEPLTEPPRAPIDLDLLPTGALRAAITEVVGVRALLELARVRLSVRVDAVLDERQKTVVRLSLEQPDGLGQRVRVLPLRGYARSGQQVTELLRNSPELNATELPLVDQAALAAGRDPAGVGPGLDVGFGPEQPADLAVASVLLRLTEVRSANLPGVLADLDSEFLHDYRVALRRSRAVVRELGGVFPADQIGWLRAELRWLQRATGDTRDLDVYLHEFQALRSLTPESLRNDLEPLRAVLHERHRLARAAMVQVLLGPRAGELQARFVSLLETLPGLGLEGRLGAREPITAPASASIRKLHHRMIRIGRAIEPTSPPADYHELRKQGKELRYMLEIFGRRLHDPETVRSLVRSLKALQDVLGRHQDREVQIEMLRGLAEPVAAQAGGPAAVLAMGAMVDRLEEEAAAARAEFRERFLRFSSHEQRRLVKDTFS